MYGYLIATVTSVVTNIDANTQLYYQKMANIHAYMRLQKFPRDLQHRVHDYFTRFYDDNTSLDVKAILNDLDPKLREEVGLCMIQGSLLQNYLFRSLPENELSKLPVIFKLSIFETGRYVVQISGYGP